MPADVFLGLQRHPECAGKRFHLGRRMSEVMRDCQLCLARDKLDLHFPKVDKADRGEFKQVREALEAEENGEGKSK
jgi:hypothetical protein